MDFKLIILLFILIMVIYLIFMNMKVKVDIAKNKLMYANIMEVVKNKINLATSEIKTYNNTLVSQIKKINNLNSQIISSVSNYYTETETERDTTLKSPLITNQQSDDMNKQENNTRIIDLDESESNINYVEDETKFKLNIEKSDNIQENIVSSPKLDIQEDNKSQKSNRITDNLDNKIDRNLDIIEVNNQQENTNQLKSEELSNQSARLNIHTSRNDVKDIGENESLNTAKILSLTQLNPINTYTKSSLDYIARILCIPTTYINNDKRTTYKKDELYKKIEEHLKNK